MNDAQIYIRVPLTTYEIEYSCGHKKKVKLAEVNPATHKGEGAVCHVCSKEVTIKSAKKISN